MQNSRMAAEDDVRLFPVPEHDETSSPVHSSDDEEEELLSQDAAENELEQTLEHKKSRVFSKSRNTVRLAVVVMKLLMFLLVLSTLVASKVSIVIILNHLHSMTDYGNSSTIYNATARGKSFDSGPNETAISSSVKTAVNLYWQLLLIVMIPNAITWVRAFFNGVLGKSSSQPWPSWLSCFKVSLHEFVQ